MKVLNSTSSEMVTKKTQIKTENVDEDITVGGPEVQMMDDGYGINIQMMKSRSMLNFREASHSADPSNKATAKKPVKK